MAYEEYSPREIYEMVPERVDTDLTWISGCYYNHIPEIEWYSVKSQDQDRVKFKTIKFHDYDGRRFWLLGTVWFDDKPVMIVQNAGREGDDHAERFITDFNTYREMVGYIASLIEIEVDEAQPVDIDTPNRKLTTFYNGSLGEPFERW